jgi:hypothetical protein
MLGTETLILEAAKGLVGIVVKTGWDSGSKLFTWLGKNADEKTKQLIFDASKQYARNYIKRHGELKVLGMRESVSLESIYTSVQLL